MDKVLWIMETLSRFTMLVEGFKEVDFTKASRETAELIQEEILNSRWTPVAKGLPERRLVGPKLSINVIAYALGYDFTESIYNYDRAKWIGMDGKELDFVPTHWQEINPPEVK